MEELPAVFQQDVEVMCRKILRMKKDGSEYRESFGLLVTEVVGKSQEIRDAMPAVLDTVITILEQTQLPASLLAQASEKGVSEEKAKELWSASLRDCVENLRLEDGRVAEDYARALNKINRGFKQPRFRAIVDFVRNNLAGFIDATTYQGQIISRQNGLINTRFLELLSEEEKN